MRRAWIVANVVAVLVFVLFAALQWNDPDPWLWIPIYASPAIASGLAITRRLPRWVPLALGALALVGTLPLLPAGIHAPPEKVVTDMQMHAAGVEEAREAIGLLIVAAWMAVLAFARPKEAR